MGNAAGRFIRSTAAPLAALVVAMSGAGCGGDKSGGPTGAPGDVVGRAPDVTLAAATARITINAPTAAGHGVVDFASRSGQLTVTSTGNPTPATVVISAGVGYLNGPGSASSPVRLATAVPDALRGGDPLADIDLVRGAVHILSDGGNEVEGASTIGYSLTIDPQQALDTTAPDRRPALAAALAGRSAPFPITVWIDSQLRIRRLEVPTDLKPTTPSTRSDRLPIATDVDFVQFGVPAPAGAPSLPAATPAQTGG